MFEFFKRDNYDISLQFRMMGIITWDQVSDNNSSLLREIGLDNVDPIRRSTSTSPRKIADKWQAIVTAGRIRRKHRIKQGREKEKEIQKQERIEWERYLRDIGEE